MTYVYLILAFTLNGFANIFLKLGALNKRYVSPRDGIFNWVQNNIYILFGLGLFAVNVILYIIVLKRMPLTIAYPIMIGMTFLIINVFSLMFLNEKVGLLHIGGLALILGGVIVFSYATGQGMQ